MPFQYRYFRGMTEFDLNLWLKIRLERQIYRNDSYSGVKVMQVPHLVNFYLYT